MSTGRGWLSRGKGILGGYRNGYGITHQGFHHLPLTIVPILPVPRSYQGTCVAVVRQQSFHLLSTQLPLRKQAFRVMLGLFISYKDVIRQISSADTQGCLFNGCVLPRLVISRQPLLQNHTLHPRPCIRNLTTSNSAVMKAYVSHRLGLSYLPARFDVRTHAEPLCKSLVYAHVSFSSRLSVFRPFSTVMYSNHTDVFLPPRRRLSFQPITFMVQFIRALDYVSRSLAVSSTRLADEPFPHSPLLSHS